MSVLVLILGDAALGLNVSGIQVFVVLCTKAEMQKLDVCVSDGSETDAVENKTVSWAR